VSDGWVQAAGRDGHVRWIVRVCRGDVDHPEQRAVGRHHGDHVVGRLAAEVEQAVGWIEGDALECEDAEAGRAEAGHLVVTFRCDPVEHTVGAGRDLVDRGIRVVGDEERVQLGRIGNAQGLLAAKCCRIERCDDIIQRAVRPIRARSDLKDHFLVVIREEEMSIIGVVADALRFEEHVIGKDHRARGADHSARKAGFPQIDAIIQGVHHLFDFRIGYQQPVRCADVSDAGRVRTGRREQIRIDGVH